MIRLRPSSAALLVAALALSAAGPARAADPVGVEACRQCHPRAVAVWEAGPHARAERGLGTRPTEPACLVCHAPLRDARQVGVTCEACHGAGEHYAKSYVMRDRELARAVGLVMPGEKECRACHDAQSPSLAPFDFARAVKLTAHGKADREARKSGAKGPAVPAIKPVPAVKPPPPRPPAKLDRPAKESAR
jgi:hypothetical protein